MSQTFCPLQQINLKERQVVGRRQDQVLCPKVCRSVGFGKKHFYHRTFRRARQSVVPNVRSSSEPATRIDLVPQSICVAITGGSKGLGYALAAQFLSRGATVVICGRNQQRLMMALESLSQAYPGAKVCGMPCDVSSVSDMEAFAQYVAQQCGTIHYWINNAGEVTGKRLLCEVGGDEIVRVVGTNVTGSLLGCREAIRLMMQQSPCTTPCYHIFNMGFSPWGAKFSKSAVTHKSTKTALTQLTHSLNTELTEAGCTTIGVHNLSPGMVLTDLLLKDSTPLARRFFNTLAEEPETVAGALVPQILAVQGSGSSIEFLNPLSAISRVVTGVGQIVRGGRFFDKDGNRVVQSGEQYGDNGVRLQYSTTQYNTVQQR